MSNKSSKRFLTSTFILLIITVSCSKHKETLSDNHLKVTSDTLFYSNGNVKYIGTYKNGLRMGRHFEFYEKDSGAIKYEAKYELVDGGEKLSELIEYDKKGNKTFIHSYQHKPLILNAKSDSVLMGDTLYLSISFKHPQHNFIRAYTGDIDPNLGVQNPSTIKHYIGQDNVVTIPIVASLPGINTVRGHIVDFDIEPVGDSTYIGMTGREKGEITFFEYRYYVESRGNR